MQEWAVRVGLRPVAFAALQWKSIGGGSESVPRLQQQSDLQWMKEECDVNEVDEARWGGTLLHLATREGLAFSALVLVDEGFSVTVLNAGANVAPTCALQLLTWVCLGSRCDAA